MATRRKTKKQEILREEAVNILLAEQLQRYGLSARAERRSREGAPDVRIELRSGDLLLLECKWEGSAGLLDEQVRQRVEQLSEALGILGVVYADRLQAVETSTKLSVRVETCVGDAMGRARGCLLQSTRPLWLRRGPRCLASAPAFGAGGRRSRRCRGCDCRLCRRKGG